MDNEYYFSTYHVLYYCDAPQKWYMAQYNKQYHFFNFETAYLFMQFFECYSVYTCKLQIVESQA